MVVIRLCNAVQSMSTTIVNCQTFVELQESRWYVFVTQGWRKNDHGGRRKKQCRVGGKKSRLDEIFACYF